jgi:hypothetical protein
MGNASSEGPQFYSKYEFVVAVPKCTTSLNLMFEIQIDAKILLSVTQSRVVTIGSSTQTIRHSSNSVYLFIYWKNQFLRRIHIRYASWDLS